MLEVRADLLFGLPLVGHVDPRRHDVRRSPFIVADNRIRPMNQAKSSLAIPDMILIVISTLPGQEGTENVLHVAFLFGYQKIFEKDLPLHVPQGTSGEPFEGAVVTDHASFAI